MNKSKPPEAASATPPPRCPPKAGNQTSTTAWMEPSNPHSAASASLIETKTKELRNKLGITVILNNRK